MTEQSGPRELVRVRRRRRAGRLRLRGDERPLLPVAHRAGARAVRLDGAGRGRPGHRAGRADDLRDLPDAALPPGRRGPEGRDAADPRRGPVHPRPRQRREPQRARRRRGLAGDRRTARTCSPRRSRSSASCTPASSSTTAATTSRSTPPGSGTCPTRASRSASRSRGDRAIERFAPLGRPPRSAVEPEADLVEDWNAADGAPRIGERGAGDRPDPDLLGPRRGRRGRSGRTSSSAGSAAAGRSTPTCRPRPASPARRSSSGPRTSPSRSRAAPTSTRSSRPSRPYWEAGFTDVALVQIGDEGQDRFLDEAAGPLLEKLRAAAPESCLVARQLIAVNRPRRCVGVSISSRIASARSSAEIVDAPSASRSSTSPPRT